MHTFDTDPIARRTCTDTLLELRPNPSKLLSRGAAACVVLSVDGYPQEFPKGQEVVIDPIEDDSIVIFHAGTIKKSGKIVNMAGRVVNVCARGASLSEALAKAYGAVPKVRFEGATCRRDIGYRALEQLAVK